MWPCRLHVQRVSCNLTRRVWSGGPGCLGVSGAVSSWASRCSVFDCVERNRVQTGDESRISAYPTSRCIRWCTWLQNLEMESDRVARHIVLWLASPAGVAGIRDRSVPKAASERGARSDYWPDRNKSRLWRSGHLLWISNLRKAGWHGWGRERGKLSPLLQLPQ